MPSKCPFPRVLRHRAREPRFAAQVFRSGYGRQMLSNQKGVKERKSNVTSGLLIFRSIGFSNRLQKAIIVLGEVLRLNRIQSFHPIHIHFLD